MDNLYVESVKNYKSGFVLKEQDFQKLIKIITDQFEKEKIEELTWDFSLKYKNGVVSKTKEYGEIFEAENEGLKQVIGLSISAFGGNIGERKYEKFISEFAGENFLLDNRDAPYLINISFSSEESLYSSPIKLKIKGLSRDWVFLTTSELEERISKLRRIKWPSLFDSIGTIIIPIIFLTFLFPLFTSIKHYSEPYTNGVADLNKIINKYNSDSTYSTAQIVMQIEANRLKNEVYRDKVSSVPNPGTLITIIFSVLGIGIFFFAGRWLQIPYVFYWGEYMEVFDRREKIKNFFIYTVLIGIVLSIISNYISDFLK